MRYPASQIGSRLQSEVQVGLPGFNLPGTVINLEDDLRFDKHATLPEVSAGLKLGKGWRIGGEYYSLGRDALATIKADIVVDDVVYPAAAAIASKFSSDIYRLTVGYSFLRGTNYDVGAALGFHVTKFKLQVAGIGRIGSTTAQTEVRNQDLLAPLPTIGLYGSYEPFPRVTVSARFDWLKLKISDYTGRLINTEASVSYRVFDHVGIGAKYRFVDYRVGVDKTDWNGEVRYRFSGPAIFLEAGF